MDDKKKRNIAIVMISIIIISIISVIVLTPPGENPNPNLLSEAGFQNGDYFSYRVTGFYNGSTVIGSFNVTIEGNGWGAYPINTSNQELNARLFEDSLSFKDSSFQIGISSLDTPFGVKQVVDTFRPSDGWATIYYIGINPTVVYGYAVNAPDFHLDMILNTTNNQFAKSNNTEPISWHNPNLEVPSNDDIAGGNVQIGLSTWSHFYNPNDNHLFFNLTAKDIDVYVFSESNIRSMATGGPFACDLGLTRVHASNETGDAMIFPGLYVIFATGHSNNIDHFQYYLK
jgi:hypothetical protein